MNHSRGLIACLTALALACANYAFADEAASPVVTAATPAAETPQSVTVVGNPTAPSASEKSWYGAAWDTAGQHLSDIWHKGDYEVYVPFWTYHMPYAYSAEKRATFTSYPAGGGIGKGWFNESGNWEGIFAVEFADSHGKPQYQVGYGWVPTWHPLDNQFRVGAGLTAFVFMRSDIANYAPLPGILPVGSIGYGPVDVQVAYIPGGQGNGNVLFWWAKFAFR